MGLDFDQLAREYQHKIYRLALSLLRDPGAAEDAAQEALVRIWKGLPAFREDASLSTWIYTITRNTCLTALGRAGKRTVSIDDAAPRRQVERAATATWHQPPLDDAAALLDQLPAKYRAVVALFYMEERSYEEVAHMLGMPIGTVRTYLFRARKHLAERAAAQRVGKGEA